MIFLIFIYDVDSYTVACSQISRRIFLFSLPLTRFASQGGAAEWQCGEVVLLEAAAVINQ